MSMKTLSGSTPMTSSRFAEAAIALRNDDLEPSTILKARNEKEQGERLPDAGITLDPVLRV